MGTSYFIFFHVGSPPLFPRPRPERGRGGANAAKMSSSGLLMLLLVLLLTVAVEASALSNVWGWWFNNGKELDLERKVNIVAQMMTTGGDIMATAAYVKVCRNTVTKYWNLYLQNGTFTKEKQKPGPKPALGAGALFYLFYLVQLHNAYTCAQYADRLFQDLGISVTDWVIMRALGTWA